MDSIFDNLSEITISIVTYNSIGEIDTLLASIMKSTYYDRLTTFVVDNASNDGTADYVSKKYPWIRLMVNKSNYGFGSAHNQVIRNVNSKYHIIANPDIRLFPKTIEESILYMDSNCDVSIMTPLVLNVDMTQQYLPKRNPSMKYMIGGMFENWCSVCKRWRDEYTLKGLEVTEPIDVDFCTGAFMVVRTDALHKIGGFDESYFLHFEDADLTRKLKKEGRAMFNPNVQLIHKWQRDNKKINKSFGIALKSMFIYMRKWHSLW